MAINQNRCVRACDAVGKLVASTASQRPANLKHMLIQEYALETRTRVWKFTKLLPIGWMQDEVAKMYCEYQILQEGSGFNLATQASIGSALAALLEVADRNYIELNIKDAVAAASNKYMFIYGKVYNQNTTCNLQIQS